MATPDLRSNRAGRTGRDAADTSRGADWLLSGLLLAGIAAALGGFHAVLGGMAWWWLGVGVAALVLLAAALVRSLVRSRLWPVLAALLAGVGAITAIFAPGSAIFWVIPTADTPGVLAHLQQAGFESVSQQSAPADAVPGILYLVCAGVAMLALAMDIFAFALGSPALSGLPLIVPLLVPSRVAPSGGYALLILVVGVIWLAILLVRARPAGRRAAAGMGAGALVLALVLPAALPAVDPNGGADGLGAGVATGINPIITLGADLRRGSERLALVYTSSAGAEYLRLAALDDFTGQSWKPSSPDPVPGNLLSAIGPAPGLGDAVPAEDVLTRVSIANIASRWLPAPYAPTSVDGVTGDWSWDADTLAIRSASSNARNQSYTVTSRQADPTIEQLMAAGTALGPGLGRYLALPSDLPPVVASTAREVVGAAATNYEKAIALQSYFTDGQFRYSEDAPVQQGYDGSGAGVLAAFLAAKSGYCVHFSSAMAAMARTLGIPARVAVGFTPGTATSSSGSNQNEFRVSTHDLHAWPELYFAGIGWVRFEPTPGRGTAPAFAPRSVDDPRTPNVDESKPITPTNGPTRSADAPSPTGSKALPGEDPFITSGSAAPPAAPSPLPYLLPLLVALCVPFVIRTVLRGRRSARMRAGSALDGWAELRDTAYDLGLRTNDARTPRQLSADLAGHLDDAGVAALARLRTAVEGQAFAGASRPPDPADLRAVLRSLRRDAGPARRVLAAVLPLSLFARWLAEPGDAARRPAPH